MFKVIFFVVSALFFTNIDGKTFEFVISHCCTGIVFCEIEFYDVNNDKISMAGAVASQDSEYEDRGAGLGIDGFPLLTEFSQNSCVHTEWEVQTGPHWWKVRFESNTDVVRAVYWPRTDQGFNLRYHSDGATATMKVDNNSPVNFGSVKLPLEFPNVFSYTCNSNANNLNCEAQNKQQCNDKGLYVCLSCKSGYYLQDDGTCALCTMDSNCVEAGVCDASGGTLCLQCKAGFYHKNSYDCDPCLTSKLTGCRNPGICDPSTGDTPCLLCNEGYFLKADGSCELCLVDKLKNCKTPSICNATTGIRTCSICDPGFYKQADGSCTSCLKDSLNCLEWDEQSCDPLTNKKYCKSCNNLTKSYLSYDKQSCVECGQDANRLTQMPTA